MELPSSRELELEALVRQRDGQVAELNDEVTRLRQYIARQPPPSATEPVTLPPPLMNLLLPHIQKSSQDASSSSTVLNALTQRVKLLQEENDELYQILNVKETGKLKEEVRALRRVVHRLEGSLRESHQVIDALSTELDKAYETVMNSSKQIPSAPNPQHASRSPRSNYHTPGPNQSSSSGGISRLPPTGPRAFKKPRLSDQRQSPPEPVHHPLPPNPRTNAPASSQSQSHRSQQQGHNNSNASNNNSRNEQKSGSGAAFQKSSSRPTKMEVDEDAGTKRKERGREREKDQRDRGAQQPSDDRDRERDVQRSTPRDKDRGDNDKERNKDRDRGGKDRERNGGGGGSGRESREKELNNSTNNSGSGRGPAPRRNGVFQGNSGRGGHQGGGRRNNPPNNGQGQSSLAERMGL